MEGNLRFKIDWASLIVGRTCTVFALFYFVFEGNFPSTSPGGQFNGGFFALPVWGLIFGGAYFQNSTVCQQICPPVGTTGVTVPFGKLHCG